MRTILIFTQSVQYNTPDELDELRRGWSTIVDASAELSGSKRGANAVGATAHRHTMGAIPGYATPQLESQDAHAMSRGHLSAFDASAEYGLRSAYHTDQHQGKVEGTRTASGCTA